jgi:hypothetical protein
MNSTFLTRQLMDFMQGHRGRENAIPRERVLFHLQGYEQKLDDRRFRDIYASLPLCACAEGLFLARTIREVEEFREYLSKKSGPIIADRRVKIILSFYPRLRSSDERQPGLF